MSIFFFRIWSTNLMPLKLSCPRHLITMYRLRSITCMYLQSGPIKLFGSVLDWLIKYFLTSNPYIIHAYEDFDSCLWRAVNCRHLLDSFVKGSCHIYWGPCFSSLNQGTSSFSFLVRQACKGYRSRTLTSIPVGLLIYKIIWNKFIICQNYNKFMMWSKYLYVDVDFHNSTRLTIDTDGIKKIVWIFL